MQNPHKLKEVRLKILSVWPVTLLLKYTLFRTRDTYFLFEISEGRPFGYVEEKVGSCVRLKYISQEANTPVEASYISDEE